VCGSHAYHDFRPGCVFEAVLDPAAEQRAVDRGAIVILDATPPGIRPGSYRPPDGWVTQAVNNEAPRLVTTPPVASLIEGSN
jgi:hypothetical protein